MVLDLLAPALPAAFGRGTRGRLARTPHRLGEVLLLKPQTFMNLSGQAAAPLVRRHGLRPDDILVVHDDLDLATGRIRFRRGGGDGGHRGVASLIEQLGTADFCRLKIGIGRPPAGVDPAEYVLLRPQGEEADLLAGGIGRAVAGCLLWIEEGLAAAMNQCNPPPSPPSSPHQCQPAT